GGDGIDPLCLLQLAELGSEVEQPGTHAAGRGDIENDGFDRGIIGQPPELFGEPFVARGKAAEIAKPLPAIDQHALYGNERDAVIGNPIARAAVTRAYEL